MANDIYRRHASPLLDCLDRVREPLNAPMVVYMASSPEVFGGRNSTTSNLFRSQQRITT